ncbi:MAG: hypothetical protein PHT88_04780 [Candidatus Moranbacteria bacterium]|nr:hypothetical protein [Candidatus Moranbacteria bacterium]
MIYPALAKGPYKIPGVHDKDCKRLFGLILRPASWSASTVYSVRAEDDYDVVMPSVFTGLYYKVIAPGKSGALEPAWIATVAGQTVDGTTGLTWEAVAYNLMPVSESISSVVCTPTNNVVLSGDSNTAGTLQFMIEPLPAAAIAAGSFEIDCLITKNNAEKVAVTLKFKVGER